MGVENRYIYLHTNTHLIINSQCFCMRLHISVLLTQPYVNSLMSDNMAEFTSQTVRPSIGINSPFPTACFQTTC